MVNVHKGNFFYHNTLCKMLKKTEPGPYHFLVVRGRGGLPFPDCFLGILEVLSVGTDNWITITLAKLMLPRSEILSILSPQNEFFFSPCGMTSKSGLQWCTKNRNNLQLIMTGVEFLWLSLCQFAKKITQHFSKFVTDPVNEWYQELNAYLAFFPKLFCCSCSSSAVPKQPSVIWNQKTHIKQSSPEFKL